MSSKCPSGYVVYDYEGGGLVCNDGSGNVINDRPLETEVGLTPVVSHDDPVIGYGVVSHGVDTRDPLGRLSESAFRVWRDILGGVVSDDVIRRLSDVQALSAWFKSCMEGVGSRPSLPKNLRKLAARKVDPWTHCNNTLSVASQLWAGLGPKLKRALALHYANKYSVVAKAVLCLLTGRYGKRPSECVLPSNEVITIRGGLRRYIEALVRAALCSRGNEECLKNNASAYFIIVGLRARLAGVDPLEAKLCLSRLMGSKAAPKHMMKLICDSVDLKCID